MIWFIAAGVHALLGASAFGWLVEHPLRAPAPILAPFTLAFFAAWGGGVACFIWLGLGGH